MIKSKPLKKVKIKKNNNNYLVEYSRKSRESEFL